MKAIRLLAVMMLVASLTGCMAKKAVIDESSAVVRVDTTKTVADSLIATKAVTGTKTVSLTMTHVASDTTKFAAQVEESTVIDFVDSGGTVNIDTAGIVSLTGVKSIKSDIKILRKKVGGFTKNDAETLIVTKETSKNEAITNTRNKQANGITSNEQKQNRQEMGKTVSKTPTLLERIKIGFGGCAIGLVGAAVLFLIWYAKRKDKLNI